MTTPPYPEDASVPPWGSPDPVPQPPVGPAPGQGGGLRCPVVCGHGGFREEEEGRMSTMWGMASHTVTIRICERCQHALFFHQGAGFPT